MTNLTPQVRQSKQYRRNEKDIYLVAQEVPRGNFGSAVAGSCQQLNIINIQYEHNSCYTACNFNLNEIIIMHRQRESNNCVLWFPFVVKLKNQPSGKVGFLSPGANVHVAATTTLSHHTIPAHYCLIFCSLQLSSWTTPCSIKATFSAENSSIERDTDWHRLEQMIIVGNCSNKEHCKQGRRASLSVSITHEIHILQLQKDKCTLILTSWNNIRAYWPVLVLSLNIKSKAK